MNAVLGSKPLYVYTHACTSVFPSVKWSTTCFACSSNNRREELGFAMDLDVEGPLKGPTLLGNSKPRSILQGQPFCSTLMRSVLQAACSVLTQAPGLPLCRRCGLSVTSSTSLENQDDREIVAWEASRQIQVVMYVSAEEPGGVPKEARGRAIWKASCRRQQPG